MIVDTGHVTMKEKFEKPFRFLENLVFVVCAAFLGLLECTSNLVNGYYHLTKSAPNDFASNTTTRNQQENDLHNNPLFTSYGYGITTILLVWLPGALRVLTYCLDQTWRDVPFKHIAKKVSGLILVLTLWPLLSNLM